MIPQVIQRGEDGTERPAFVMRKQSRYVLKQKIRGPSGLSQSGHLKEESTSGVVKAPSFASVRKRLAGESAAQQVEVGHSAGVNFSGIGIVHFLLSDVVDGAVAGIGVLVDLAVADTLETARAGQSGPKAADPREHIKIADQSYHLPPVAEPAESRGRSHPRPRPAAPPFFLLRR